MARGESGRIVLEIDPELKNALYNALDHDELTLKNWFLREAERYLRDRTQFKLYETVAESPSRYKSSGRGRDKRSRLK